MLHWYWVWISNAWYHKRLSLKLIYQGKAQYWEGKNKFETPLSPPPPFLLQLESGSCCFPEAPLKWQGIKSVIISRAFCCQNYPRDCHIESAYVSVILTQYASRRGSSFPNMNRKDGWKCKYTNPARALDSQSGVHTGSAQLTIWRSCALDFVLLKPT